MYLSVVFLSSILPYYCLALTYWVDTSCRQHRDFDTYLGEAVLMARKASTGITSTTNIDFHTVFNFLFRADINGNDQFPLARYGTYKKIIPNDAFYGPATAKTARNFVNDIMDSIGHHWSEAQDRAPSNLRFYCSEAHLAEQIINRADGKKQKLWIDRINSMKYIGPRGTRRKPCTQSDWRGYTMTVNLGSGSAREGSEAPMRNVVILCPRIFDRSSYNEGNNAGLIFNSIPEELRPLRKGIEYYKSIVSFTILHEWTHTQAYQISDVQYGWHGIVGDQYSSTNLRDINRPLFTRDGLNNADNYAYLGLWALLASRRCNNHGGYGLERLVSMGNDQLNWDIWADWERGKVKFLPDITV